MSTPKPSLQQQRDLLQLQADVLRLKIVVTQMKTQHTNATSMNWLQAWQWANQLPLGSLALKKIIHTRRWQHKAWISLATLGWMWLRGRS